MGDYGQYNVPLASTCINLKVGQPNSSFLPLDILRECSTLQFSLTDPNYLQYGDLKGYHKFRLALAEFLSTKYSTNISSEELFITNGVTGGLSLLCSLFTESHDLVFIEEPSYFLAIRIMRDDYKLNLHSIPLEEDGLNINYLRQLLEKGLRPKFLYTIPTCHNPTGRTMSLEKRKALLRLAQQYHFLIIADEVYQLLSFPEVIPPPSMFNLDTLGEGKGNEKGNHVIALGSFSKILAPALRLGWIQASEKHLKILCESGQLDSSGGNNPVIQGIVHQAILTGHQTKYIEKARLFLYERANALMKTLDALLPSSCSYEKPLGGYFLLVKLPAHCNAADLLPIAEKHKVLFLPGSAFSNTMKNYLRLSFSWYTPKEIEEGVHRLVDAIKEFLQLSENQQISNSSNTKNSSANQPSQIKVGIHGHTGRLGSLIAQEIANNHLYTKARTIQTLDGIEVPDDARVIIDVTLAAATKKLVSELLRQKRTTPLIIGTTGDLPMKEIEEYSKIAPVVIKSNFSAGVPLMCKLANYAVNNLPKESGWNCEIMEIHHTKKLDAPSGTAKTLKRVIELADLTTGEALKTVPCTSQRLGDEIGQHTIYFAGPGERIEIKHQATKREVFAIGAVRTVGWILKQSNGLYID